MSSTKCSECGLTNFLAAEHCKRCRASLPAPAVPAESTFNPAESDARMASLGVTKFVRFDDQTIRVFSPLRVLIVVLLIVGGVWYLIDRDDKARAAQLRADKEFDLKRQADDLKSRPMPVINQGYVPPVQRH